MDDPAALRWLVVDDDGPAAATTPEVA